MRPELLFLFTSDQQLDILFDSKFASMDGTCLKTPPHLRQIYKFYALKHEIRKEKTIFRNIFICLLKVYRMYSLWWWIKESATYREIFFELKNAAADRGKSFLPSMILTGFETSVIAVVKTEMNTSSSFRFE